MAILTLEITGSQSERLGTTRQKTFTAEGGSIGRLPDNYWMLPDQYVSNRHAMIRYVGGVFYIEDTSTNGVFINSPENRLVKGQPHALKSGDWIFIEPYEIKASIIDVAESEDPFAPWPSTAQPRPVVQRDSDQESVEVDPLVALGLGNKRPPKPVPKAPDLAAKSLERDHFMPPSAVSPEPPAVSAPQGPQIPHDYDPLLSSDSHLSRPARSHTDSRPAPSQQPQAEPPRSAKPVGPQPSGSPERLFEERPRQSAIDLGSVLIGAGLDNVTVTPELARNFGQILRVVVGGVMDVLQARQKLKSEFRIGLTTFRPADNNPLKFSANVDDALHNLLVKRNPAYLAPVEAFEDAFDDVKNHQMAMLAGLRVAFETMLAEFTPEHLQEEFDRQLKKASLLPTPAKLRYWELYREKFHDMVKDPEKCFRELFGEAFADAYEEQLNLLKSHGRLRNGRGPA
jgi:type VI secretion system FHA domain protein